MMIRLQTLGFYLATSAVAALLSSTVVRADEAEKREFFENKIRPLLVQYCFECHSGEEIEAGLSLESKPGWEFGGDNGAAIIPGKPDESLLVDAVRYTENLAPAMPPDSKLSDEEIALFEKWVQDGAFDPRTEQAGHAPTKLPFDVKSRADQQWCWQPIKHPAPPQVNHAKWPTNSVDSFILARIEQAGLHPADDATPEIWLRRVYFDLIGLPPSPQQIAAFLADPSAAGKAKVVDELLGSDHFGEKWARHWMDLTRYADSYGHEFDYPIRYAHEYRDYLIRAFNADVPYDQFLTEHVAGDLIESPRRHPTEKYNESVIATGSWFLHEATHAPTDVLQNEADIASNQIDVFAKSFLGLTVACARCHDHKFDAISTADYHSIFAYLQSSGRRELDLDPNETSKTAASQVASIREGIPDQLKSLATGETELHSDALRSALEQAWTNRPKVNEDDRQAKWNDFTSQSTLLADFTDGKLPEGWQKDGQAFVGIDNTAGLLLSPTGIVLQPHSMDSSANGGKATGSIRSPYFELTANQIHLRIRGDQNLFIRFVMDNYQLAPANALLFRGTFINGGGTKTDGNWKWVTLGGDMRKYVGHRGYLEIVDNNGGSIAVDQIWMSPRGPAEPPEVNPIAADDFETAWQETLQKAQQGQVTPMLRWALQQTLADEAKTPITEQLFADLIKQLADAASGFGNPRFAITMTEVSPETMPVYIRGSHKNPGETVSPRNLQALGGREGSRLELANELTTLENPLTSRVIVNRLWHHLFGRGIVASLDDFGPQGIAPTHPDLIDHLATTFVQQDDWSIKAMLRRLVLSRTYGQASVASPTNDPTLIADKDPSNLLLHRMSVRRLPAESIRDGILASAGTLNRQAYGPGVSTHRTAFMSGRGARGSGPLDGAGRRSVYLTVYRNFLNPMLSTFDRPTPFGPKGKRSQSNVPAQSLVMMNDPFIVDQAKRWAQNMARDQRDAPTKISEMVLAAHGTTPSPEQQQLLSDFLQNQTKQHGGNESLAWQDLAQSLWTMKAYLYLR
ncbi:Planctomycete cytochrome C [Stieleria bergensis]|uniref:Planctomycete cytochrome C n=1 Tax=Stieleria bergensis TaxID=2528025 RepID=A0A517SWF4_9BACT|nr:Planctomycete cytochrome C [Planctomycetes bacterium SV_7m_r]